MILGVAVGEGAIVIEGVGESSRDSASERSIPELVLEAVEAALADAGVGFDGFDAVVTASVDLFDGLTASNIAVTEVVGAVMRPETRIAADGLLAAAHAACLVRAGAYARVLVVAHGKASMARQAALEAWALDPIYVQPLGVDFAVCSALQARLVMEAEAPEGGEVIERRWAARSAERRRDAARASRIASASAGAGPSAEEVLASALVASPLRAGLLAPECDGAAAVLLAAAPRGEPIELGRPRRALWLGSGHDLEPHALGERNLSRHAGLGRACERAYRAVGISDPADAFAFAEPSCRAPHEEELFLRESGLGAATALSSTGGSFAGTAPCVGGLARLITATRRLRAGAPRERALVHGAWGPAGQGQVVAILEGSA